MRNDFPIVGIGASAGGIEALESFFKAMPADPGMAFVVVTHLAPGRQSMLPEIIDRFSPLPAKAAANGDGLEPGQIYVKPPDVSMEIENAKFVIRKQEPDGHRNPIDIFFVSLAADQADCAVGIVLSGSGSDGSIGIKAIKEAGGLTMAQGGDGTAPRHADMPQSAIATGLVDIIASAGEMPARLTNYAKGLSEVRTLVEEAERKELTALRQQICSILFKQLGHDFSGYKSKPFMRRVTRRMQVHQIGTVQAYVDFLRHDKDEARYLLRDLLIGVTEFFRDADAFHALETTVLPKLFGDKVRGDTIRIWVPGCSTGEEVYSHAILLSEQASNFDQPTIQVFATDIDESALALARAGRYPAKLMEAVSPERLKRFFTHEGNIYSVSKQIREMCVFSTHSIIRDPPFSRMDLISCRNLLIYLGANLQDKIMGVFHYALRPGGYLFLGTSENLSHHSDLFSPVEKKHRIFQRRDHVSTPIRPALTVARGQTRTAALSRQPPPAGLDSPSNFRRAVDAHVLDRFAPAHVVVNREGEVVYYSGRTGKYLEAAQGAPDSHLFSMSRRGLRVQIRSALHEAAETRRVVVRERLRVDFDEAKQLVDLIVEPLPEFDADPLFLVIFKDVDQSLAGPRSAIDASPPAGDSEVSDWVEQELRDTRAQLQSLVEDYETSLEELRASNEELVSLNEELQSTNEELETSKEEIQSVNEELSTVNLELSRKVEELDRANADLRNLFESTDVATLFLDGEGVIRSYTPAVTKIFNLLPTDRGRPLTDISSRIGNCNLKADLDHVLQTQKPVTRQVKRSDDSVHYLMRILPYLSADDVPDGVVLTFVDVTQLVDAQAHLKTLVEELNHRVRNMLTVVTVIANQTLARNSNLADFKDKFMGRINALAETYSLVSRENWDLVRLDELLRIGVSPYEQERPRITLEGPRIALRPKAALALGMVVHELATNAVKHGALSVPAGNLTISWGVESQPEPGHLVIVWTETGGPTIAKPKQKGFGAELINRELQHELGGKSKIEYREKGLIARLTIPCDTALMARGC